MVVPAKEPSSVHQQVLQPHCHFSPGGRVQVAVVPVAEALVTGGAGGVGSALATQRPGLFSVLHSASVNSAHSDVFLQGLVQRLSMQLRALPQVVSHRAKKCDSPPTWSTLAPQPAALTTIPSARKCLMKCKPCLSRFSERFMVIGFPLSREVDVK
jgi:hypothetical protein